MGGGFSGITSGTYGSVLKCGDMGPVAAAFECVVSGFPDEVRYVVRYPW